MAPVRPLPSVGELVNSLRADDRSAVLAGLTALRAVVVAALPPHADTAAAPADAAPAGRLVEAYLAASPEATELLALWDAKHQVRLERGRGLAGGH
jgi:hypothetical protein